MKSCDTDFDREFLSAKPEFSKPGPNRSRAVVPPWQAAGEDLRQIFGGEAKADKEGTELRI